MKNLIFKTMGKVLRIYEGSPNIMDWDVSVAIGSDVINGENNKGIKDPNGGSCKKEITSIPSPFARIDLMKTAFRYIVDNDCLDGNTIYHKMVSDCFDVGEIFFNIDKLSDKIEIIVWDKNRDLRRLLESDNYEHAVYGRTLDLFLRQDGKVYNFDKIKRIYLLNYIGKDKPDSMNIIGATSPATLFFTSANNLDYVSENISFGNDRPFDENFLPLYKREFEYRKYIFSVSKYIPDFALLFPEVDRYMQMCYRKFSDREKHIIDDISADVMDEYDDITVAGAADYVEILGFNLKKRKENTASISESDFMIAATRNVEVRPLVLPVDTYTKNAMYVSDKWDRETKVPYYDEKPLSQRRLPKDNTLYPYLTLCDFLEDHIIKTRYKINSKYYFDGNDTEKNNGSYMLPLKKEFFNYFTPSDLRGTTCGKRIFELERLAGDSVKAILRVPVRNGFIAYEKIYFKDTAPDRDKNTGSILNINFTLAIVPLIKYDKSNTPVYRVSLIDRDSLAKKENEFSLFFLKDNETVKPTSTIKRNRNKDNRLIVEQRVDSSTYSLNSDFDIIELSVNRHCCLIVPEFVSKSGSNRFKFAVDFGTTNTHIEYSINESQPVSFDIGNKDEQILKYHETTDNDIESIYDGDFIPDFIGGNSKYKFPIRTVLAESVNTDWNKPVTPMLHTNIPFIYEKEPLCMYNNISSNLKWSNNLINQIRIEKYIENIFILLRNKVLLNNGDLNQTEIVWFYPASMTKTKFSQFRKIWEELYLKYFGENTENIVAVSESFAPYYYHERFNSTTANTVCIDIGGGTTDVLIVSDKDNMALTSFRFAANTIFGDEYSDISPNCGFVKEYIEDIENKLTDNNLSELKKVLSDLKSKQVAPDIIAFFFSLSDNRSLIDRDIKINFSKMLYNDEKSKYVFILFYTAIIYHIASIMKEKKMRVPRYIAFSGTGSKIIELLAPDKDSLSEFTIKIFEKIYGSAYHEDGLNILTTDNPKEATCKGGIYKKYPENYSDVNKIKLVLTGLDNYMFADSSVRYSKITEKEKGEIVKGCRSFLDFMFDLNKDISFNKEFGAPYSILESVKKECYRDLEKFVQQGLDKKINEIKESGAADEVEESLFFYPLVGVINALSRKIYQK